MARSNASARQISFVRSAVQRSRADIACRPTVQTFVKSIDESVSIVERGLLPAFDDCWILWAYALGAGEFGTLDPVDRFGETLGEDRSIDR